MPLASALPSFKSSLDGAFQSASPTRTPVAAASDIGDSVLAFATQGIPMTMHSGNAPTEGLAAGQAVAGAVTSSPGSVTASGSGGIDTPSPGMGLSAAKSTLVSTLTATFSNPNNSTTDAAGQISDAINAFLSQAKVMTKVTAIAPPGIPVPPPAGPVGPSAYVGSGIGGLESDTPGAGLAATLSILKVDLAAVFSNPNNTPGDAASGIADALESHFLTAMITTVDNGTAGGGPAVVAPPPAPPVGVTSPPGSNIISGASSTGVIA